jgi:hypothetical protein
MHDRDEPPTIKPTRRTESHPSHPSQVNGYHVTASQPYYGASVTFGKPWGPWLEGSDLPGEIVIPNVGTIRLETGSVLRFSALPQLTQQDVERFLIGPLRALLMILAGRDANPAKLVLEIPDGRAVSVHRPPTALEEDGSRHFEPVIRPAALGLAQLEAWFQLSDAVVPVATIIAKTLVRSYDVEMKVMNLAASAEAIHRELYDVKTMTGSQARQARRAAVEAVPEEAKKRVSLLLIDLRSLTYGERLELLLERLHSLGDEVAGKVFDAQAWSGTSAPEAARGRALWVQQVKSYRNNFAHLRRNSPQDTCGYAGRTFVLYESLRWTLTAVLLTHIGLPLPDVHAGLLHCSSYHLFRERAAELWPEIYRPES